MKIYIKPEILNVEIDVEAVLNISGNAGGLDGTGNGGNTQTGDGNPITEADAKMWLNAWDYDDEEDF